MKKFLLSIASVALMMSACTQDVVEQTNGNLGKFDGNVTVTATMAADTRTAMAENAKGGLDITWVEGDEIGLSAEDDNAWLGANIKYTANQSAATTGFVCAESENDAIKWGEGTHYFYAYYPYTEGGDDPIAVPASVPAVQKQSAAGNTDHLQDYAFLYASATTEGIPANGNIDLQFNNAFSVLELDVCAESGSVLCEGLIFRAESKIGYENEDEIVSAENILVNLEDGSLNYEEATTSNEIRIDLGEGVELNSTTAQKFYMLITPGHGGKRFSFYAVVNGKEMFLGNKGIPAEGLPAGKKAELTLNVPIVDLSLDGTANTYIVPSAGKYSFDATVKGNGYIGAIQSGRYGNAACVHTFVKGTAGTDQTSVDLTPASAEVLWFQAWCPGVKQYETRCPIVASSVELKNGRIEFETTNPLIPGNAVIAAKDSKGEIIWSWHIWISEGYNAFDSSIDVGVNGIVMMDRNIGANISNENGVKDGWKAAQAVGMTYQHGRKDPFTGPLEISKDCGDGNRGGVGYGAMLPDGTLMYGSNGAGGSNQNGGYTMINQNNLLGLVQDGGFSGEWTYADAVAYANAHPQYLIHNNNRGSNGYPYDWWGTRNAEAQKQLFYYWGGTNVWPVCANITKTIYDPCPAGWFIPGVDFSNAIADATVTSTEYGWNVALPSGQTAYFPHTGVRWGNDVKLQQCNTLGAYWVNAIGDAACGAMNFVDNAEGFMGVTSLERTADFGGNSALSMGISTRAIRCVKETGFTPSKSDRVYDLSGEGTSNCYIVNKANTEYKFKATVKGNGVAPMAGETAEITPTKARILWAQSAITMKNGAGDNDWPTTLGDNNADKIIDAYSVTLKDGYISFKTGKNMPNGNVVIAATDDTGNILWSWHLWVLNDYDVTAEDYYVTASNLNFYMMDRNLGATATPKNGVDANNEWVGARGYYYQWGRKDPFPTHNGTWNGYETKLQMYNTDGTPAATQYVNYSGSVSFPKIAVTEIPNASDVYASVAYAVANPMTYITGAASSDYMWTAGNAAAVVSGATNEWGKLWGNQAETYSSWDKGGVKTMYDPCPAGYRVPSVGHFRFITSHGDNAGASHNYNRNWKYNINGNIFADDAQGKDAFLKNDLGKGNSPYGFYFYVKGSKTAAQADDYNGQDNGNLPADQTTAYFPAQGFIRWSAEEKTKSNEYQDVYAHTNCVKNAKYYGYGTYYLMATAKGEFFNNCGASGSAEQQAKALPVRCVRE